jgi:hypothetical protein
LDYMIADQKKKGNVMMVAFYIRPEWTSIDEVSKNSMYWYRAWDACYYDYVSFEKYLKDNFFNTTV